MIDHQRVARRRTGLSVATLLALWAHSALWGLAEAAVAPPEAPRKALSVRIVDEESMAGPSISTAVAAEIIDVVMTPARPPASIAATARNTRPAAAHVQPSANGARLVSPAQPARAVVDTPGDSAQPSTPSLPAQEASAETARSATFLAQADSAGSAASQQAQASTRPGRAANTSRTDARPGTLVTRAESAMAPPSTTLHYLVRRGAVSGDGELVWQHDGQAYTLHLSARVPILGVIFDQLSRGQIESSGLVPTRFTEKRIGKGERAVNLVRGNGDAQPYVSFSSRTGQLPWVAGMQDRLSWMAQLAARLQGWSGEPQAGDRLEIPVVGASGDVQRWHFLFKDSSVVDGERQWHLLREPEAPFDTLAEVWISPAHGQFPVRVRLTESQGDPLELTLK